MISGIAKGGRVFRICGGRGGGLKEHEEKGGGGLKKCDQPGLRNDRAHLRNVVNKDHQNRGQF